MAEYSNASDDDLLAATQVDPEAFAVFYRRHLGLVLGLTYRATGEREQALDLTAEVFAAALVASRRYRPNEAPASAWLVGIVRNKLAASQQRRAREDAARRKLGIPRMTFSDEALERVDDNLSRPADRYVRHMADLSPVERDAVAARVIEERDYAEIAETSGTSQAAVRQRVSRGLAKLARIGQREG